MNAGYQTVKSRILVALLSVLMVFGNVASPLAGAFNVYAEGGSASVATWAELKEAIEIDHADSIEITADLYAEGTINVNSAVTIKGKDKVDEEDPPYFIYQKLRDEGTYNTMFSVPSGGTLTLGTNLTLSGMTSECTDAPDPTPVDENPIVKTTQIQFADNEWQYVVPKSSGVLNIGDNGQVKYDVTKKGYIKLNGNYLGYVDNTYKFDASVEEADAVFLADSSSNQINGENLTDATDCKLARIEGGLWYFLKYVDESTGYITVNYPDDGTAFKTATVKPPTNPTQGTTTNTTTEQQCKDPKCANYTNDNFGSGTEDNPKGFFVQVDGGSLTINQGTSLQNFITDKNVKNVAPVVVKGGNFTMNGGEITKNSVGYNADNSKSGNIGYDWNATNKSGDSIYRYVYNDWTRTDTSGGVILLNNAVGSIEGGSISGNRGDTGALYVRDGASVKMTAGNLNDNVGIHYGGAAYIYDGGKMIMNGGAMEGNFSWDKGGAVCVSSETYSAGAGSQEGIRSAGFELNGGELNYNTAVRRGGALEVKSNDVILKKGTMKGNVCRALGGAVYVEGDNAERMYRLYIESACITGNAAVREDTDKAAQKRPVNAEIDKKLKNDSDSQCGFENELVDNNQDNYTGDWWDYANWGDYQGYGGGLWLCTIGGNASFGETQSNSVIIDGNTAEGTDDKPNRGNDINLRPARGSSGSAINIYGLTLGEGTDNWWVNEETEDDLANGGTYTGPLRITNKSEVQQCKGDLQITGNVARIGGGIAGNGTFIFGTVTNTVRLSSGLKVVKSWDNVKDEDKKPITLSLALKDGTPIEGYSITLDGEKDTVTENATVIESEPWKVEFSVPLTAPNKDGDIVPLYTIIDPETGDELNPSLQVHQIRIYELANGSEPLTAKYNFVITETIYKEGNDGSSVVDKDTKFVFDQGEATIEGIEAKEGDTIELTDLSGKPIGSVKVNLLSIDISQGVQNSALEVEKYINQNVHKDISVNESFTYDVIAYVPKSADKFTITDKLNEQIQFKGDGSVKVYDLGTENNHMTSEAAAANNTTATVATGTEITNNATSISTNDGLAVVFDDGVTVNEENGTITREREVVKNLRGHYVRVEFVCELSEVGKEKVNNYLALDMKNIHDNDPLVVTEAQKEHVGVPNKAEYEVVVANKGEFTSETNTVTVKSEKEEPYEVEKYINKKAHQTLEYFDDSFDYQIMAYVPKDATEVRITDELEAPLEFVKVSETGYKGGPRYLADNGLLMFNDNNHIGDGTNGTVAKTNENFWVAQGVASGTRSTDDYSINVDTTDSGKQKLTVVLKNPLVSDIRNAKARGDKKGQGFWIRLEFKAKYRDGFYDAQKVQSDSSWLSDDKDKNNGNTAGNCNNGNLIDAEDPHHGTANKAGLEIKRGNNSDYETKKETNIVTVEAPSVNVKVQKKWTDSTGNAIAWPTGKSVKVIVTYGDETDELTLTDEKVVTSKDFAKITNGSFDIKEEQLSGYTTIVNGNDDEGYVITNIEDDQPDEPTPGDFPAELEIQLSKNLIGGDLSSATYRNEFDFEITASPTGAPMPKNSIVNNTGDKIDFGKILFNKAGTFKYTIKEVNEGKDNIVYSGVEKSFTITVEERTDAIGNKFYDIVSIVSDNKDFEKELSYGEFAPIDNPPSSAYGNSSLNAAYHGYNMTLTSGNTTHLAYCLEHDNAFPSYLHNSNGVGYDLAATNNLTSETIELLKKIAYVGYPYDGTANMPKYTQSMASYAKAKNPYGNSYKPTVSNDKFYQYATTNAIWTVMSGKSYRVTSHSYIDYYRGVYETADEIIRRASELTIPDNVQIRMHVYNPVNPATVPNNFNSSAHPHAGPAGADIQRLVMFDITIRPETATVKFTDSFENTVLTKLKVKKTWGFLGLGQWPENTEVTFGLFYDNGDPVLGTVDENGNFTAGGDAQATVTLDGTPAELTVTGLPKLTDRRKYTAREIAVTANGTSVTNNDFTASSDGIASSIINSISGAAQYIVKIIETALGTDDAAVEAVNSKPEIEKYVNDKVHAELEYFDKEFTYDIMAYMPIGATSITITDNLTDQLKLKSTTDQIKVVYKDTNNHMGNGSGTVSKDDEAKTVAASDIEILNPENAEDNNVVVKVSNSDGNYDGKWIQVTFDAEINPAVYDAVAAKIADDNAALNNWETISENDPVIVPVADKEHTGLTNKASYTIQVGTSSTSEIETNEVTVKPEVVDLEAKKVWQDAAGEEIGWPEGTDSVVVNVIKNNNKNDVATTIELTKTEPQNKSVKLPKLVGVTYSVDEATVPEGYTSTVKKNGKVYEVVNTKGETPEIEKYVNKDVHSNIVEYDRPIRYDILAYVTKDADKVVITDKLVQSLEFAKVPTTNDEAAVATTTASEAVASITKHEENNHEALTGTVNEAGTAVDGATLAIENNTLTVTIDDAKAKGLRGKYVKVTFYAKYTKAVIDAVKIGDVDTITDNGLIVTEITDHTGTTNDASYEIFVGNESKYGEESNTVTVEPEETKLRVRKVWSFLDYFPGVDTWPENMSVTFGLFKNDDALKGTIKEGKYSSEGDAQAVVVLNDKNHEPVTVEGLPKLVGVEYTAREIKVNDKDVSSEIGKDITNIITDAIRYIVSMAKGVSEEDGVAEFIATNDVERDIKVSKQDIDNAGPELPGATLTVKDSEGNEVAKWVSGKDTNGEPKELPLKPGTYTLEEVGAPDGFIRVETVITFTVNPDGSVTMEDATATPAGAIDCSEDGTIIIKDKATEIYVSKVDITNGDEELPGATLQIIDKDGNVVKDWVSGDKPEVIRGLKIGDEYTLRETIAPDGYTITSDTKFTIDEKGKLTSNGTVSTDSEGKQTLVVNDSKTKLSVSKVDITNGDEELPGATLQIIDSEGKVFKEWVSGDKPEVIEGLKTGVEYTLRETIAPDGYTITSDTKFTIDEKGKVTSSGTVSTDNEGKQTLVVEDSKTKVKFSKVDLGGEELPGATIQILKDGKVVELNGAKLEWTSTDEPKEIEGLPAGTYVMHENAAPAGFDVATDITFIINPDGSVKVDGVQTSNGTVEMTDRQTPKIEKYVNPANATEDERNETVHTDLSAFDEVYTYDIQAYITADATYVIVEDTLKEAVEFADKSAANFEVFVKDGTGRQGMIAPALGDTSSSVKLDASEYSLAKSDFAAGQLVVTLGDENATAKLGDKFNGKWLQIKFNAKIKDDYRSIQALKDAGEKVWEEVVENPGIDSPDNNSGDPITAHEGVENDSTYKLKRAGVSINNGWTSDVKSNHVTVEPKTEDITVKKTWNVAGENKWPEGTTVTFGIFEKTNGVVADEPIMTVDLTEKKQSETVTGLPCLENVEYVAREIKVNGVDVKLQGELQVAITDVITYIVEMAGKVLDENGIATFEATNTLKTNVKINKTDLGGNEIAGAKIRVTDANGNEVKDIFGNVVEPWTSVEGKTYDLTLDPGIYKMTEVNAPEGYIRVTTEIEFEVKADGTVEVKSTSVDPAGAAEVVNGVLVLKDELNDKPETEKYVGQAVHKYVGLDDVFTYDIVGYVTKDADKIIFTDTLASDLEFAGADVKVSNLGTANNHKPTNNINGEKVNDDATVAVAGEDITEADGVSIEAKDGKLTVVIDDDVDYNSETGVVTRECETVKNLRGNYVRVTFQAQIKKELQNKIKAGEMSINDLESVKITENTPVDSSEAHEGIVNEAMMAIEVDGNGKYETKTNKVTVKPEEHEVEISKNELGGSEIPGATIKVTGPEGFEETWVSGDKPHLIIVPAGEYTMTEVVAPEGYQSVTTEMVFKVDEDGKVELVTVEVNGGGKISVDPSKDNHIILEDAPEKPSIEKYVNKQYEDLTEADRDGTVHTDLSAFDEIYTYDIQAYITADATYVELTDELQSVLEFVGDKPVAVVVKDGQGASKAVAPALTSTAGQADVEYKIDADAWKAGKLILTIGEDKEDAPKLYPNGKWLQITFNAKIKDEYKSIEALKAAGADVWTEVKENGQIDDADVVASFSGAAVDAHEGIVNDSNYKVKSCVAGLNVDNGFAYDVKSNTVTVQPKSTEISVTKKELGGSEIEGALIRVTDAAGRVVDEWVSTKESHILHLADGEYTLTEVVAPEGYYAVTTAITFEIKEDNVVVENAVVVDGMGSRVTFNGNDIVVEDAPEVQGIYEPDEDEGDEVLGVSEDEVKSVRTGDETNLYIWFMLMIFTLCAIVLGAIKRFREDR